MASEPTNVQRYNDFQEATSDGAWVRHSDYADLERAVEVLVKNLHAMVANDRVKRMSEGNTSPETIEMSLKNGVRLMKATEDVMNNPTARAAIDKCRKETGK